MSPAATMTEQQQQVAAANLRAGQRITIGRYDVELLATPTVAPRRLVDGYLEVILLVREVPTALDDSVDLAASAGPVWTVTVGAEQLFVVH